MQSQRTLKLSTYIFLHCCSKLAFHLISWWRCTNNPQTINLHLPTLLQQAGISHYFMMKMNKQPSNYQFSSSYIVASSWHFTLFHDENTQTTLKLSIYVFLHCCIKLAFHFISWWRCTVKQPSKAIVNVTAVSYLTCLTIPDMLIKWLDKNLSHGFLAILHLQRPRLCKILVIFSDIAAVCAILKLHLRLKTKQVQYVPRAITVCHFTWHTTV